jgi:hypothetical protein
MIRTNCKYIFQPVGMDLFYEHGVERGEEVTVVPTPRSCPNPRHMKMVYIRSAHQFCTLVLMASLQPRSKK